MAKKKEINESLNLDNILFNCRNHLKAARYSGSFFEKRDMRLTLIFLRFIGEKYDDGIAKLRETLIAQNLDPDDDNIRAAFFDDATFIDGAKYEIPEFYRSVGIKEIENNNWTLHPSKYIEFIDHDLDIDYEKEMTRIQREMKEVMKQQKNSQKMLEEAFRGIGYEL